MGEVDGDLRLGEHIPKLRVRGRTEQDAHTEGTKTQNDILAAKLCGFHCGEF
jgi:hypothetical protein